MALNGISLKTSDKSIFHTSSVTWGSGPSALIKSGSSWVEVLGERSVTLDEGIVDFLFQPGVEEPSQAV